MTTTITTTTKPSLLLLLLLLFSAVIATTTTAFSSLLSRPSSLAHPTVILVSTDAFRFGYQFKAHLPSFSRLATGGTSADLGLIPVFPTLTFPNHYSIATGLFPPHHGIVDNRFLDPVSNRRFSPDSTDPLFWLGEPIWATAARCGLPAATFFWPGSEVHNGQWTCPPRFCQRYNKSVPFEFRVQTVLGYFDLPPAQIPSLITLYLEEPDWKGHRFGPDDPEITNAVVEIDRLLGSLISGLETRGVFDDVHVILVGDHGMVGICGGKYIFLEDLNPWIEIDPGWVRSYSPLLSVQPPPGVSAAEVVAGMNEGLGSGNVTNGERLRVYLKEDLPGRLHYSQSDRIPAIVGLLDEGYEIAQNRSCEVKECGGDHGYDNAFFSMRSIFVAHGPRFARGRSVPSFENIEIYNVIAEILGLEGAPNNGSASFARSVLLPVD